MMKRIIAQVAVIGVGAVALLGLGGVSNALAGRRPVDHVMLIDTTSQVDSLQGELKVTRAELERAHQVLEFSGRYGIPGDLSARIYDNAVAEGIPPTVGFQLVQVESRFQNGVQSGASAIGLTQLRLPTARVYDTTLGPSDLMNPDVNLRIGFRYLKDLLKRFDQDVALALEAYNKGPTLIAAQQDSGSVVKGRYSHAVMSGAIKSRRGSE
jgi:soluble lytic murein transglycosylase-like protein